MKSIQLSGNDWNMFLDQSQQTIESARVDDSEVTIDGLKEITLVLKTDEGSSFEFVGAICRIFAPGTKPSKRTIAASKWLFEGKEVYE